MTRTGGYDFYKLQRYVKALYRQKRSYRRIAREDYQGEINHAVIQRIIAGIEPKRASIRFRLGLPALMPAPVCPMCGIVHLSKQCPLKRKRKPNPFKNYVILIPVEKQ